jgi:carbonic anhydrase/acetyltransferase-like protein (isoleucine patch superfamily)
MNAVVLEHARVGKGALVAAGSTVLASQEIPPDSLAAGSPARVKRAIEGSASWWIETSAGYYVDLARRYKDQGRETGE